MFQQYKQTQDQQKVCICLLKLNGLKTTVTSFIFEMEWLYHAKCSNLILHRYIFLQVVSYHVVLLLSESDSPLEQRL